MAFCSRCAQPMVKIEIIPLSHPYDEATGQLVATKQIFACENKNCIDFFDKPNKVWWAQLPGLKHLLSEDQAWTFNRRLSDA
jgi:hypothetical protein